MRRLITFDSKGNRLVGTLDVPEQPPIAGVLIVSGGNELRCGAHRGMAMLARDLAAAGLACFRFDRAGVGDSPGANDGYAASKHDICAASFVLGKETGVDLIIGLGNCDAAAALALFGREAGVGSVILANPWLGEEPDALPPPAAIRARYAARLKSPREWLRLLTGKVDLRKLASGLGKLADPAAPRDLQRQVIDAIAAWGGDATVVLAKGDATAIGFAAAARLRSFRTCEFDTASHSFAGEVSRAELARIIEREVARARKERAAR